MNSPAGKKNRLLVLGAGGKLGRMLRHIWESMPPTGCEITAVSGQTLPGVIRWQPGMEVTGLPACDVVLALWGVTRGDAEALAQNSRLAREAVHLAQALGARRVLHCSSAAVYRPGPDPLRETAPTLPVTPYGRAKLEMEQEVFEASQGAGIDSCCLRIGNVAGAESLFGNMRPDGVVKLDRFEDGSGPLRSYVAPQDLARGMIALAQAAQCPAVVNVAAPVPTAMVDLARLAGCRIDWQPAPPSAVPRLILDTTLFQEVIPLGAQSAEAGHLVASARASGVWPAIAPALT